MAARSGSTREIAGAATNLPISSERRTAPAVSASPSSMCAKCIKSSPLARAAVICASTRSAPPQQKWESIDMRTGVGSARSTDVSRTAASTASRHGGAPPSSHSTSRAAAVRRTPGGGLPSSSRESQQLARLRVRKLALARLELKLESAGSSVGASARGEAAAATARRRRSSPSAAGWSTSSTPSLQLIRRRSSYARWMARPSSAAGRRAPFARVRRTRLAPRRRGSGAEALASPAEPSRRQAMKPS
mmetsp:Transcript_12708/g.31708  ORF Transcript_12708/g.31708 Transcript_12708/m.31708 type:complete len:247 (+) Transcript_12708:1091-1831(+)